MRCFTQQLTHRYVVEGDVSDVIVGAALPRVVEPEAKGAGVPSLQSCVLPKCAVLHVDGAVVDLHAPDRKITAGNTHTHQPVVLFTLFLFIFLFNSMSLRGCKFMCIYNAHGITLVK